MRFNDYVEYVIGTFLTFPITVIHILTPVEVEPKRKRLKYRGRQVSKLCAKEPSQANVTQQGVKRTCGNAQKSVRVKHNSVPALKHK